MPSSDKELLTVIIPCYNEQDNISETLTDVLSVAPTLPMPVEIVMINDGSTDGTLAAIERLAADHPQSRVVDNPVNLGLGRSVLNVYPTLDPRSWVTVFPGDNEFVFSSIQTFLDIRHEHDLILGYLKNAIIRTFARRMASHAFTSVVNFLYGYQYRYLGGMKLYRASAFQGLEILSGGHAFNAELLAKAILRNPSLRVGEAPFLARGRAGGSSKAFRPGSVIRAVADVARGQRSVARYRDEIVKLGKRSG